MTDSIVCTLGQYDIPIIQMQPPFKVDLLDSNENGFLTDENGISFYDLSGNLQWSFNKYDVSSAWLYGKNVFVKLNGYDGKKFPTNEDMYIAICFSIRVLCN